MGANTILPAIGRRGRIGKRLEQLRPRLLRLARSWTRNLDNAEDLVQDCFIRAIANLGTLRDESRLDVWVTRILSRLYLDQVRRKDLNFVDKDIDQFCDENSDPLQFTERADLLNRIELALGQLSDEARQIVTLVDVGGYSYSECAQILEVPVGTVMSRLSRGRDCLLKLIRSNEDTAPNVVELRRKN